MAVLVGGAYAAYAFGMGALKSRFTHPDDYEGAGTGAVVVEVKEGEAATDIATTLADKDVVKSAAAFTEAARKDPSSVGIQVGFYRLRHQMSAKSALAVLVNPDNRVRSTVTIPEGYTVKQIVATLAKKTDFSAKQYNRVLRNPASIGLPAYAHGNPEGYLFPATYELPPTATPRSVLAMMVKRYDEAADHLRLTQKAGALGSTPHDVMVVASMVQ